MRMGTVVTVMNMKGGVGKTTVTMHLGGLIGRYLLNGKRRKVLLVDYDPQFNLSQAFIPAKTYFALEKARKTCLAILVEDDAVLDPFHIQVPGNEQPPSIKDLAHAIYSLKDGAGLEIVPSTLDLMYVALGQIGDQGKPIEERFSKFVAECRGAYDLIFLDCHPAGSLFTKTALQNSDHVIIPVMPQRYSVRGIGLMFQFIAAKTPGSTGPTAHILFNAAPRAGIASEETAIRSDAKFGQFCLTNTLKEYKAFSEPQDGDGFVWYSKKPWSTRAFQNLHDVTEEFLTRIGA